MAPLLPPRLRLLVSVRSAAEAVAALEGGADIIDVKDPARGPLGMASPRVIETVLDAVGGRAPVSVALGELSDAPDVTALPRGARSAITFAKVGLHGQCARRWQQRLHRLHRQLPQVAPVAVHYHDDPHGCPSLSDLIQWCLTYGGAGVLIDTYVKDGRGLLGQRTDAWATPALALARESQALAGYVAAARSAGKMIALAGQLSGASLTLAAALEPDIIAVRGAACVGNDRGGRVDADRVRAIKSLLKASREERPPVTTLRRARSPIQRAE